MPRRTTGIAKRGQGINERLLAAATEVFLQKGYGATTIEDIAAHAKASKITFYNHFGDKEKLFEAVAQRFNEIHLANFASGLTPEIPLREGLRNFAREMIEILLSPDAIGIVRVLQAEAQRFPQLGQTFDQTGPVKARRLLQEFLRSQMANGILRKADCAVAAEQFIHLAIGEIARRRMLGLSPSPNMREMRVKIEAAIDTFTRAYAANVI